MWEGVRLLEYLPRNFGRAILRECLDFSISSRYSDAMELKTISTALTTSQIDALGELTVHTSRAQLIRDAVQEFLDRRPDQDKLITHPLTHALPAPAASRLGPSAFGSGVTS